MSEFDSSSGNGPIEDELMKSFSVIRRRFLRPVEISRYHEQLHRIYLKSRASQTVQSNRHTTSHQLTASKTSFSDSDATTEASGAKGSSLPSFKEQGLPFASWSSYRSVQIPGGFGSSRQHAIHFVNSRLGSPQRAAQPGGQNDADQSRTHSTQAIIVG